MVHNEEKSKPTEKYREKTQMIISKQHQKSHYNNMSCVQQNKVKSMLKRQTEVLCCCCF